MTTKATGDAGETVQITPSELRESEDTSKWYEHEIKIPDGARTLLEQYSGFAPDEVVPHIRDLRDRAFAVWPYPCIGRLRFLELTTSTHPDYPEVVSRLKSGQTFLDVGCCLGQDLRKLMYDGAPSSAAMSGVDIESAFFDLGFELFRDREKMHATFLAADLTKAYAPAVTPLLLKHDVISAQSLFHLFNLKDQKTVAKHLVSFTKPSPGSIIVGRQAGDSDPGEKRGLSQDAVVFLHNLQTFEQLWQDVGEATNSKWKVDARTEEPPGRLLNQSWSTPGIMILLFKITRL